MTDQEQLIKTLTDELALQTRIRRQEIAMALIGRGYPPTDVPGQAQSVCDWVEGGMLNSPALARRILKAAGKKRGRPAKKSAVPKGKKRKYTKRSKFWAGKGKD